MSQSQLNSLLTDPRIQKLRDVLGSRAELYIVGGAVRDALRGIAVKDVDLASALSPQEILISLEANGVRVIPTGLKHQTVTALPIPEQHQVEITTFRGAGMSPLGGVVQGDSIDTDLGFRDFTINALALSVESGSLLDPHNGQEDLAKGVLRAVGSPRDRFIEDPLRTLRLVRFASQEGFQIEPATFSAAIEISPQVAQVAIERVRDEFTKILLSPHPSLGFHLLRELSLLELILPEFERCVGCAQNKFHKADVYEHTLEVVSGTSPELLVRLAALFHDIAKPLTVGTKEDGERTFYLHEKVGAEITKEALLRLKYPHAVVDAVSNLVLTHMRPVDAGKGGLRRILRDTGENFNVWRELKEVDSLATLMDEKLVRDKLEHFDKQIEEIRQGPELSPLASLAVRGNDLIELGLTPSPKFKEILHGLHELVLDNPELNTKEQLITLIKQNYLS